MREAFLVAHGELVKVTASYLEPLKQRMIFKIAKDTYKHLIHLDSKENMAWYELGVLEDVDQFQDKQVAQRLLRGIQLLSRRYPLTVQKAQRLAESETKGVTKRSSSRRSNRSRH